MVCRLNSSGRRNDVDLKEMDLSTKPRPFLCRTKCIAKTYTCLIWGTFVGHARAWDMRAYRITRSDWSHCQFD